MGHSRALSLFFGFRVLFRTPASWVLCWYAERGPLLSLSQGGPSLLGLRRPDKHSLAISIAARSILCSHHVIRPRQTSTLVAPLPTQRPVIRNLCQTETAKLISTSQHSSSAGMGFEFEVTPLNVISTSFGAFVLLYGAFSHKVKERLYLGEAPFALFFGILLAQYGVPDYLKGSPGQSADPLDSFGLGFSRFIIGQCRRAQRRDCELSSLTRSRVAGLVTPSRYAARVGWHRAALQVHRHRSKESCHAAFA